MAALVIIVLLAPTLFRVATPQTGNVILHVTRLSSWRSLSPGLGSRAAFGRHEDRTPTHGYAATRKAAMAALAPLVATPRLAAGAVIGETIQSI
jgi:hypothetical protein